MLRSYDSPRRFSGRLLVALSIALAALAVIPGCSNNRDDDGGGPAAEGGGGSDATADIDNLKGKSEAHNNLDQIGEAVRKFPRKEGDLLPPFDPEHAPLWDRLRDVEVPDGVKPYVSPSDRFEPGEKPPSPSDPPQTESGDEPRPDP